MRYELSDDSQEVTDHKTGLIWRRFSEPGEYTFYSAKNHAQEVSQQTGLPWRVPTIEELASLVDRPESPASSFPDMQPTWFWSASLCIGDKEGISAWVVSFKYGYVYGNLTFQSNCVRLVRDD